jgi:hypothetical protein
LISKGDEAVAKSPRTLREQNRSKAAYTLVDLSGLDDELRKDIILDATEGGGIYGIRVVEESVNGGARAPIYGVYNEGPDADRWADAKEKLGISGEEVDDSEVYSGAGLEVTDPRKAAALREGARLKAAEEAENLRTAEDSEVAEITGDEDGVARQSSQPTPLDHTANIVDPGALGAENEVSKAPNQADTKAASSSKTSNKAPK